MSHLLAALLLVLSLAACKRDAPSATTPGSPAERIENHAAPRDEAVRVRRVYRLADHVAAEQREAALAAAVQVIRERIAAVGEDATVVRKGEHIIVELEGPAGRAPVIVPDRAVLELRRVLHDHPLTRDMITRAEQDAEAIDAGVRAETDSWRGPDGRERTDSFLAAPSRQALATYLARTSPATPDDGELLLGHEPSADGSRWRTYLVSRHAEVDGSQVADASASSNDMTGQPEVQLTLDDGGRKAMEAATRAALGDKLAIVVDGEVESAPVVMSPITGGRLIITLGADPAEAERAAAELVEALRAGALPSALELVSESQ